MVFPDMAVCTSPGFCALPSGMFSAAHTMPMTRTLGLSRAMARMAPSMAAPPAMSYFINSILSAGLMEMPPGIEGDAFADEAEHGAVLDACRLIAQDNQRGRLLGALGDAPEGAHLQFVQLVCRVDSHSRGRLRRPFGGALAEDGRGELVARLVDQRAGEVLAFADDDAFSKGGLERGLVGAIAGRQR